VAQKINIRLTFGGGFLCAKAATAVAHFSHRNSVRLSVCHTGGSVKNGASYDHQIFTVGCPEDSFQEP